LFLALAITFPILISQFKEPAVPQVRAGPHDRHVMAKHSEVYPSPEELEAVQSIVSRVECALKTVSDQIDTPKDDELNAKPGRWATSPNGLWRLSQWFLFLKVYQVASFHSTVFSLFMNNLMILCSSSLWKCCLTRAYPEWGHEGRPGGQGTAADGRQGPGARAALLQKAHHHSAQWSGWETNRTVRGQTEYRHLFYTILNNNISQI